MSNSGLMRVCVSILLGIVDLPYRKAATISPAPLPQGMWEGCRLGCGASALLPPHGYATCLASLSLVPIRNENDRTSSKGCCGCYIRESPPKVPGMTWAPIKSAALTIFQILANLIGKNVLFLFKFVFLKPQRWLWPFLLTDLLASQWCIHSASGLGKSHTSLVPALCWERYGPPVAGSVFSPGLLREDPEFATALGGLA